MACLLFSRVWEDYQVELDLVEKLHQLKRLQRGLNVALIASGGDTLLQLLKQNLCDSITAVDSNPKQIQHVDDRLHGRPVVAEGVYEAHLREWRQSNWDTRTLFSNAVLFPLFGEVVERSTNLVQRFAEIKNKLFFASSTNYFRKRLIQGRLSHGEKVEFDPRCVDRVRFECCDMIDFLEKCTLNNTQFDLIQVSNITDWMDAKQRQRLFKAAFLCLEPNGILLARRLDGKYDLRQELNQQGWNTISIPDRSCFYQECIAASSSSLHKIKSNL